MVRAGGKKQLMRRSLCLAAGLTAAGIGVWFWGPSGPRATRADVIVDIGRAANLVDVTGAKRRDARPCPLEVNGVPFFYEVVEARASQEEVARALLERWAGEAGDRLMLPYRDLQPHWGVVAAVIVDTPVTCGKPGKEATSGGPRGQVHAAVLLGDHDAEDTRFLHAWTPDQTDLTALMRALEEREVPARELTARPAGGRRPRFVVRHADMGIPAELAVYEGPRGTGHTIVRGLENGGWERLAEREGEGQRSTILLRPSADCLVAELEDVSGELVVVVVRGVLRGRDQ